jgi:hypothetical protein
VLQRGSDRLDDAAVDCVTGWHYRPAIKDSQTVDAPMNVKVVWNLEEDADKKAGADNKDAGPVQNQSAAPRGGGRPLL